MAALIVILFALAAALNSTDIAALANDLVQCAQDHPRDCDCLNRLKRVISDCEDTECNDHFCGEYQMTPYIFLDCQCPTPEGGCMAKCCCHSPHFYPNFQRCASDRDCSQKCITDFIHNHHKQIQECHGESPCLKFVNYYLYGPVNCTRELDHGIKERFNTFQLCPCKP